MFAVLATFWRISAKTNELLAFILCCWRSCWCYYCCCGSPFCCWHCVVPIVSAAVAPLHAVAGFTVFCKDPCFWQRPYCTAGTVVAFIPAVVGVSAVPFQHAVASGPAVTGFPAVNGVLAVASFPADPGVPILAGGFVEWEVLQYRTIGIWLSACNFFLLSNYRNIEYLIVELETIGLSDIGSRPQSIGLSDIGLGKNYR